MEISPLHSEVKVLLGDHSSWQAVHRMLWSVLAPWCKWQQEDWNFKFLCAQKHNQFPIENIKILLSADCYCMLPSHIRTILQMGFDNSHRFSSICYAIKPQLTHYKLHIPQTNLHLTTLTCHMSSLNSIAHCNACHPSVLVTLDQLSP